MGKPIKIRSLFLLCILEVKFTVAHGTLFLLRTIFLEIIPKLFTYPKASSVAFTSAVNPLT